MANSGSFNTNSCDGKYLVFSWSLASQSASTNKSTINWSLTGAGSSGYSYSRKFKVIINGQQVYYSGTDIQLWSGTVVATGTAEIEHGSDGKKTFSAYVEAAIFYFDVSVTGSGSWSLPDIPRYATSVQSLKSKTETSITMNWSSDSTCDYIWYSTNNGSNWTAVGSVNGTSGAYTINGLSANTTYNIKTRVRRKDSQLTTDSSNLQIATYNWPNCTSAPNFTIGNNVTLQFYNPLNRTFAIRMWSHTSQGFVSDSINISGTSYNFRAGIDYTASTLYESIPNAKSSVYNIDSTYSGHKLVKTGGSYSVDEETNKPTFEDYSYADANTTTYNLTHNYNAVIPNYSTIIATVSVANKAFPKNSATMSRYNLIIGNKSKSEDYSESSAVNIRIDNAPSNIINLYAEDSRGLTTLVPKTATLVPYTNIQRGNINAVRTGNVSKETTLTFNGTFWDDNFGYADNSITEAKYRYKVTSSSSWSDYTDITSSVTTNNGAYSFSGLIAGDEGNTGFSQENSFNIEVVVSDELSSTTFTFVLGTGIPHIAVADDGIAIKQPYDDNLGGALQVNGTASVSKNLKIPKDSTAGYGITNSDGTSVLRNGANTNTILDATGGGLYLGYTNTSSVDILNGKAHFTSNGLNFRNNNSASIEWKENGYGDKFRIIPEFGGTDDSNKLKIQGTVGNAGTDPTNWVDLLTVSGKNGILTAQNFNYSTNEIAVGKWIDGKPIYRKVAYISSLPNATTASYNIGLSNIDRIINIYGVTNGGIGLNTPRPATGNNYAIGCWYDIGENRLKIEAGTDRRSLNAYAILEYTKNN